MNFSSIDNIKIKPSIPFVLSYTGMPAPKFLPIENSQKYSRMPDGLVEELWQIKDGMARENGYDVEAFVAHLQSRERMGSRQVVDLCTARGAADYGASWKRTDPGSR